MILSFNHTSFTVSDLDLAIKFWSKLGFTGKTPVERDHDWVASVTGVPNARIQVVHLYGHGHHLEFINYVDEPRSIASASPNQVGTGHICLEVSDIQATFERLLVAGASRLGQMTKIDQPGVTLCSAGYLRDPNGIIIELVEFK